jgi:hypothetical protein
MGVKRERNLLLTDDEILKLRSQFFGQLPIVAAIFAATQERLMDFDEASEDALNLVDALLEAVANKEE